MKTLVKFIEECRNKQIFSLTGINNEYQDKIEEALTKSFSTEKLISKLSEHYKIYKDKFEIIDGKGENRNFRIDKSLFYRNLKDAWLSNTLHTFGYYITMMYENYIYFEPIFTENITDIIQDDCNGIVYKIVTPETLKKIKEHKALCTDKDNIYNILKTNSHSKDKTIRSKSNRELNKAYPFRLNDFDYRYFYSRSFFFASKTLSGLKDAYNEIVNQLQPKDKNDFYVLEVDISKYNVNCYVDNYAGIDYQNEDFLLLYINAFFPLNLITIYTPDEFEQKF